MGIKKAAPQVVPVKLLIYVLVNHLRVIIPRNTISAFRVLL